TEQIETLEHKHKLRCPNPWPQKNPPERNPRAGKEMRESHAHILQIHGRRSTNSEARVTTKASIVQTDNGD
ncbi:hypothetical protein U1Q18_044319, partial [Sarracenia purpurea var. burkii]